MHTVNVPAPARAGEAIDRAGRDRTAAETRDPFHLGYPTDDVEPLEAGAQCDVLSGRRDLKRHTGKTAAACVRHGKIPGKARVPP